MFRNFRCIFKDNKEVQQELIPKILEMIEKSTESLQIEAGRCFNSMLRENIIISEVIIKAIHKAANQVIMTWSPEVLFEWRQAFVLSMRVLSSFELKVSIEKGI